MFLHSREAKVLIGWPSLGVISAAGSRTAAGSRIEDRQRSKSKTKRVDMNAAAVKQNENADGCLLENNYRPQINLVSSSKLLLYAH